MNGQRVTTFKFFWDDADHALEHWLQEKARQGLHLQGVGLMRTLFVFRRGEPAEMTYRLDFQAGRAPADYLQLFSDAGWEHVDQSIGWQFWRAAPRAGGTPEIFTDTESRIQKYQRLLWLFAHAWTLGIAMLLISGKDLWETPTDVLLMLTAVALTVYAVVRLVLRIRRLRSPPR